MIRRRLPVTPSLLLVATGVGLAAVAVVTHTRELAALNGLLGPLIALAVDGVPALGLAYAGYWLSTTDLPRRSQWTVFAWSFAGGVIFAAATMVTFLVRVFEGRVVAEPIFPLLVAADAGALAGFVAGYYNARARRDARRARTVSDALTFVNRLVRHDLRNDLNVVANHAALLAESSADGPGDPEIIVGKTDEALAHIETTRIIADTLLGDADLEAVDLAAVVADVAADVEETFGVSVTVDVPDRALVTANDGVRSVVDNLLENAVEHADHADLHLAVDVGVEGDVVRLRVRDDGPGIDPERRRTLFDSGGGGGLSLVGTLVDAYGGDVRAEGNEAGGTTVVVELPRAEENDTAFS
jgi:signal transduction histidine kinase